MKIMDYLKPLFFAEIILAILVAAMLYYGPWQASSPYLYELIGVITASMIATGGTYKMRDIT